MAKDGKFKHISVDAHDDDDIVIMAGVVEDPEDFVSEEYRKYLSGL